MRVVVVGAGMAGLAAALDLSGAGVDVVVMEAGRRPGGRVRSVSAPFGDGQVAETGAEWVDGHHGEVHRLLARYGLALEGGGRPWDRRRTGLHVDGELLGASEVDARHPVRRDIERYEDVVAELAAEIDDPAHPLAHPAAAVLDARSVADLLDELRPGRVGRLVITRSVQGEFACEPRQLSLLFLAQQRALTALVPGTSLAHRVRGGLSQLPAAMAAELGARVRYGAPVTAIETGRHAGGAVAAAATKAGAVAGTATAAGAVVHTLGHPHPADHVVLACSLPALGRIACDPPLPAALAAAVAGLGYGTVTKTALQYPRRAWPPGAWVTTERDVQRVYEATGDQPGAGGIVIAYTGGDGGVALGRRPEPERIASVAADVAAVLGLPPSLVPVGVSRAWGAHPRYGGAYAAYGPGQVAAAWDALRRPHGRLHLAGEHAATCTGYVEGAIESGRRVAARLLAAG